MFWLSSMASQHQGPACLPSTLLSYLTKFHLLAFKVPRNGTPPPAYLDNHPLGTFSLPLPELSSQESDSFHLTSSRKPAGVAIHKQISLTPVSAAVGNTWSIPLLLFSFLSEHEVLGSSFPGCPSTPTCCLCLEDAILAC